MRRGGDGCINLNNPTTQLEENGTLAGREGEPAPSGQFVEPSRGILLLTCGEVGRQTCIPLLTESRRIAFYWVEDLRQHLQQEGRGETENRRIARFYFLVSTGQG